MTNKILPETEEEILEEVFSNQEWQDKEIVDLKYSAMELKGALELAISLSFQAGQKQEREKALEEIDDRLHSNYSFMKDKDGLELFCIPKKHYEEWIKSYLKSKLSEKKQDDA